jgi:hypothetical protein
VTFSTPSMFHWSGRTQMLLVTCCKAPQLCLARESDTYGSYQGPQLYFCVAQNRPMNSPSASFGLGFKYGFTLSCSPSQLLRTCILFRRKCIWLHAQSVGRPPEAYSLGAIPAVTRFSCFEAGPGPAEKTGVNTKYNSCLPVTLS